MNVCQFLEQKHVPYKVIMHTPTYDAQHMAQAVHEKGHAVAKTVLLVADHGYRYLTAIVPAPCKVDLAVASNSLGDSQLRLANENEVAKVCPDCDRGALPPFGSHYEATTVVDPSLADNEEIVFEGNTHGESIRMKYADFIAIESPLVVPLVRREFL